MNSIYLTLNLENTKVVEEYINELLFLKEKFFILLSINNNPIFLWIETSKLIESELEAEMDALSKKINLIQNENNKLRDDIKELRVILRKKNLWKFFKMNDLWLFCSPRRMKSFKKEIK